MSSRSGLLAVVVGTCLIGVVVLHLMGVALLPSIVIGVLALAATLFTNWAHALHRRNSDSSKQ